MHALNRQSILGILTVTPVDCLNVNFRGAEQSAMATSVEQTQEGCTLDPPTKTRKSSSSSDSRLDVGLPPKLKSRRAEWCRST